MTLREGVCMELHYGIISVAAITDRFLHGILEAGDIIEAIASRSMKKAMDKAQEFGVKKAYDNYEDVYQDPNVDIVYISVNNGNHVKEIKQALQHGLHEICEKPIALSKQDAMEVFQLAKKKHCFLMEAQKSVFLPVTQDIRRFIQQKRLGRLQQIELSSSFPDPMTAWFHDPTQGGVVYGSANYTIEYLDVLLSPTTIASSAMGTLDTSGVCDRVSMNFLFDDVLINSRISMSGDTLHHAIFYFDKGYIIVPEFWKAREYTIVSYGESKTITHPCKYEMQYEAKHIHECIEQGKLQSDVMSAKRSIACCGLVDDIILQINQK